VKSIAISTCSNHKWLIGYNEATLPIKRILYLYFPYHNSSVDTEMDFDRELDEIQINLSRDLTNVNTPR
jgi:hypothetical protein